MFPVKGKVVSTWRIRTATPEITGLSFTTKIEEKR